MYLVETFVAADHHRIRDAAEGERLGHEAADGRGIDADDARARGRRVDQRTQDVEDCFDAHLRNRHVRASGRV
jgi:hypothetical protein